MNGQVGPTIPPRWRDEGGILAVQAAARRWRVFLLFLLVVTLIAVGVAFLDLLRPPARCQLVPLFVADYRAAGLPALPWRAQDRQHLVEGQFFSAIDPVPDALTQAALVRTLSTRRPGPTVIYLSGYARADAAGHAHLLPLDADPGDPVTWLPLARILQLLRQNAPGPSLLILDLLPPPAGLRRSVILDDVWACVRHDLDAYPDPARLVLGAAEPGQQAWASEYLGQSILGHYLRDGLLGRADADGDGRIEAHELAAFVRARVDRWARRARDSRQTPFLHGTGRDFVLTDLPNGEPRPPAAIDPRQYPDELARAWAQPTSHLPRDRSLVHAEQTWRGGGDATQLREALARANQVTAPLAPPRPPARSLALALAQANLTPSRDLAEQFQQLAFQVGPRTRGQPATRADEIRTQALDAFLKPLKGTSSLLLLRAGLDVALADPRPEVVRLAAALVRALEPEPLHVETLALVRLAPLDLPPTFVQRALEAFRNGEQAASRPRVFDWVARDLETALSTRHEAVILLESRGYAPFAEGEQALTAATTRTAAVLALQDALEDALAALDQARSLLPQTLLYRETAGQHGPAWLTAARQARLVHDRLDAARRADPAATLDDVRRQAALLRTQIDELDDPFDPDSIRRLLRAAGGGDAPPTLWRQLDGLLATTLVPGSQRPTLWASAYDLARRLEEDILHRDRHDGTQIAERPEVPKEDDQAAVTDAARHALALADLAGLPSDRHTALEALLDQGRPGLATLETQLRQAWDVLPPPPADSALWAWLADHYRYLARDARNLDPDGPAATFYGRAAAAYLPWLRASRELFADIVQTNDPPRLLPAAPITPTFEVRASTPTPVPLDLRFFTPDREWLAVTPDQLRLPAPGYRTTVDGGFVVPVRVALLPTAGEGKAPMPQGLLARVRLDTGRAFHRLVPVPLAPRAPQIVLSASDKGDNPLGALRLRTIPGQQPIFVLLTNPIDRAWNKLQVRLTANGVASTSAVVTLPPRGSQPITFPLPPARPTTTPPPATNPGAPPTPPGLPALDGPLRFEVIDLESKNDVITTRTVPVDLADPVEYVSVTSVRYDPDAGRRRLSVTLRLRRPLPPPDVTAELGFPAVEDGGATYTTGTLKGKLPADGSELTLFADGVTGTAGKALFHLSVDGWARAFLFEVTLSETGEVTPRQLFAPAVRLRVPAYALASTSFLVPVEADNAPPGTLLDLSLGRLVGGAYRVEVHEKRPAARDRRIGFAPTSPAGALLFDASLRDWVVPLDITQIRGPRELRAVLLDRNARQLALARRALTVGDTAPQLVRFIDPPKKAWNQAPLVLQARGSDTLVGVKEVNFFLGKPLADKLPPTATPVPGLPLDGTRALWGVKLPVPAGAKGPTDVSVQFVNQVGLSAFATTTIDLEDTDPAKMLPGTIKGRVLEGDRPQAGLTVYLSDDKRAERGTQVSKADGSFTFENLPPGRYRLGVRKPSNNRLGTYPRRNTDFIELAPGQTFTADLLLYLP